MVNEKKGGVKRPKRPNPNRPNRSKPKLHRVEPEAPAQPIMDPQTGRPVAYAQRMGTQAVMRTVINLATMMSSHERAAPYNATTATSLIILAVSMFREMSPEAMADGQFGLVRDMFESVWKTTALVRRLYDIPDLASFAAVTVVLDSADLNDPETARAILAYTDKWVSTINGGVIKPREGQEEQEGEQEEQELPPVAKASTIKGEARGTKKRKAEVVKFKPTVH